MRRRLAWLFAASDRSNGPVLGISGDGRGDIALFSVMGCQASALGNHKLDRGAATFASIIAGDAEDGAKYAGAAFPHLSSNLQFSNDEHLGLLVVPGDREAMAVGSGLAGSAVITVDGERIGVVGATTPYLARLTGIGGIEVAHEDGSGMEEPAAIVQQTVDRLAGH